MKTFWLTSTKKYVLWTDCETAKRHNLEKLTLAQVRMLKLTGLVELASEAERVYKAMA